MKQAETAKQAEAAKRNAVKENTDLICGNVQAISNVPWLEEMAVANKCTPAATCIATRINVLKEQQVTQAETAKRNAVKANTDLICRNVQAISNVPWLEEMAVANKGAPAALHIALPI